MKWSLAHKIIQSSLLALVAFTMKGCATKQALKLVTHKSDKFTMDLYMTLRNKGDDNSNKIISPLGLQVVLAMTAHGARGETKQELLRALHLPSNVKTLLSGYQALLAELKVPELELANNIFLDDSTSILPEFSRAMSKYFSSKIEKVSMRNSPDLAAEKINNWVEKHTHGKITKLVNSDELKVAAVLLLNAIYFKDKWATPFSEAEDDTFFISGIRREVKMMGVSSRFDYGYIPELRSKILELPYENDKFSMVIILPDDNEGLSVVEKKLRTMGLSRALKYLAGDSVRVKMPKFKIEADLLLNDGLKELGITKIFDECDLSGLSKHALKVSKVKQKAFIEVEERGTEAAAVTEVGVVRVTGTWDQSPEQEYKIFTADHPFFFAIYAHKGSVRIPIFVGSVRDPSN